MSRQLMGKWWLAALLIALALSSCQVTPEEPAPTMTSMTTPLATAEQHRASATPTSTAGTPIPSPQPTTTAEPTPAGTTLYYQGNGIFQVAYAAGVAQCVDRTPGSGEVFGASPGGQQLLFRSGSNFAIALRENLSAAPQPVAERVAWANWVDEDSFHFYTLDGEIYWVETAGEELDVRFITQGAAPGYCPAENLLAFTRRDTAEGELGGIYVRDLNPGGTEQLLTTEIARQIGIVGNAPQWTAGCSSLLFLSDSTDGYLAHVPMLDVLAFINLENSEIQRAMVPVPSTPFYFSAATNRLLYGSEYMEAPSLTILLQVDPATGTAEIIAEKEAWPLGWGEVGKSVVLDTADGHVIWDMDSAETIPIQACEL